MNAAEYLTSQSSRSLTVSWHENKRSYLSVRKEWRGITLRLHRLFETAPAPVLDALLRYILKNDQTAKAVVRRAAHLYFSTHRVEADSQTTKGSFYDLAEIYERVKGQFFSPDYDAVIGWSPAVRIGRYRHITFGTYDRHRHQIRIHPFLDDGQVPPYFIEFIVYHEMLHAVCPVQIDARGYGRSHTREFRRREKLFPQYAEAKEWEKQSLMFFKKRKSHGRS